MRILSRTALIGMSCLAALALVRPAVAQEPEREMSCDEGWQSDRASHCEINEMKIAASSSLTLDGGVNGGVTVKGWGKNEILVRARVQTAAATDARAHDLARQVIIHTSGGRIIADGPSNGRHENWSVSTRSSSRRRSI